MTRVARVPVLLMWKLVWMTPSRFDRIFMFRRNVSRALIDFL